MEDSAPRVIKLGDERIRRTKSGEGTLAHALAVWEERVRGSVRWRKRTVMQYRAAMKRAIKDLPPVPTVADFERWVDTQLPRQGLKPSSCNSLLRSVRGALKVARHGSPEVHKLYDAAIAAEQIPEDAKRPRSPPADTLKRAFEACDDHAERLVVLLAGTCGLRKGEILGLRDSDLDRMTARVHITRQRGQSTGPRKNKTKRAHYVQLGARCFALWDYVAQNREEFLSRRGPVSRKADGHLLPWGVPRMDKLMEKLRTRLGPEYFPPGDAWHAFRHYGASQMAKRPGTSNRDIANWLGDASEYQASMYNDVLRKPSVANATHFESQLFEAGAQQELLRKKEPTTRGTDASGGPSDGGRNSAPSGLGAGSDAAPNCLNFGEGKEPVSK